MKKRERDARIKKNEDSEGKQRSKREHRAKHEGKVERNPL